MENKNITATLFPETDIPSTIKSRIRKYFNVKVSGSQSNLSLVGTPNDVQNAKNYIKTYTCPQETMWKQIHEDLILVFKSSSFIAKLERQYPAILILIEDKRMVVLYGSSLVTNILSNIIDKFKDDIAMEPTLSAELIMDVARNFIALCQKHGLDLVELQSISQGAKFAIVKMLSQEEDVSIKSISIPATITPSQLTHKENHPLGNDSDLIMTEVVKTVKCNEESPDVVITAVEYCSIKQNDDKKAKNRGIPYISSNGSVDDGKKNVYTFSPANINNVNIIHSLHIIRTLLLAFDNNPTKSGASDKLRHVIIDGSNVAYHHGRNASFSVYGIVLAIKYFLQRGHRKVTVLIPHFRRGEEMHALDTLQNWGLLNYTPSRFVNNVRQVCYDDRMLVQLACEVDGVLVSNDQYRDIMKESRKFKSIIEKRLLMYLFVDDTFMVPEDPHGLGGPSLTQLLSK